MIITRRSPLTGRINELDIPVTAAQIAQWNAGALIQDVAPRLTPDEREFVMTGLMPGEYEVVMQSGLRGEVDE